VLERAGLMLEREEEVAVTWRAASLDEWWTIMLDTSRLASLLAARLDEADLARVRAVAEEQLIPFVEANGKLAVPGVARVALARRADAA
jgi:beta-lactamase superfamily II metal-dependent hydrolase